MDKEQDISGETGDRAEGMQAEERFRQAVEHAPNGMMMIDRAGKIMLVNAQIEKSFGYSRAELLGQSVEMLVPARFRAQHSSYRHDFMADPAARPMGAGRDLYGLRKDGTEFPVEIGLNPLATEQGLMVLGTITDITARKRAEQLLRESEERFRLLVEGIKDYALIMLDQNGRVVSWNSGAERIKGYRAEEIMGEHFSCFYPDEDVRAGKVARALRAAAAAGRYEEEGWRVRKDGARFWADSLITSLSDEDGQLRGFIKVTRDVSERKQAEEKLRRLATAVEQSGDSIIITDTAGNIQYVNPAFEQTTGYSRAEVIGKNPRLLKGGKASPEYYRRMWTMLAQGIKWTGHFTNKKKDGTLFEEEATISPVRDGAGKIVSYVAVKRDIAERKRAEEAIRRLNETLELRVAERTAQLEAANRELEAFSHSVSHDLRAPLRHINGFSQALLEDYADKLDAEGRGYLQEVRGASQEMAQLIDDLLQLARVTRYEMRREVVNLSELARAIADNLQKRDAQRRVTVEIEEGLLARGDKRLLQIMLGNLLDNAWKFTAKRDEAEIAFGREQKDGTTIYFVRDNGAGFDMAYADKLFGAFQRLHSASEFEGTGVGLATVQRVINRHGGRVWADGAVEKGATFCFTLPHFKEIEEITDGEQGDPTGGRQS